MLATIEGRKVDLEHLADNYRTTSYVPHAVAHLPRVHKTAIQVHQESVHRRAVAYLSGFKLICTHADTIEDTFFKKIYPKLKTDLDKIEASATLQFEKLDLLLDEFYTSLVSILQSKGIKDAEDALKLASDCSTWQFNRKCHYTETERRLDEGLDSSSLQVDMHLMAPGASGSPLGYKQNHVLEACQAVKFKPGAEPKWFNDLAPWLQNFLNHKVFTSDGIAPEFLTGCPPSLRVIPGFRNLAQHSFYLANQAKTIVHARSSIRVSHVVPDKMLVDDDEKINQAVKVLQDIVESQLQELLGEFNHRFPGVRQCVIPIVIQTPATGNPELERLNYLAIEKLKTQYASDVRFPRLQLKLNIINANRLVAGNRTQRAKTSHPAAEGSWQHVNVDLAYQHYALVIDFLKGIFGDEIAELTTNFPDLTQIERKETFTFVWKKDYTDALMTTLDLNMKYQAHGQQHKAQLQRIFATLEALTNAYQASETHDSDNLNLHIMSLESMLVSCMGGMTIINEADQDIGSMMLMHADSVFEFYHDWVNHHKEHDKPLYPPFTAADSGSNFYYGEFCRVYADKIEAQHHARFNSSTHLGVAGNSAMSHCLSRNMRDLLSQREQLRYLNQFYVLRLALVDKYFRPDFKPQSCEMYDHFFDHMEHELEQMVKAAQIDVSFCDSKLAISIRAQLDRSPNPLNLTAEEATELTSLINDKNLFSSDLLKKIKDFRINHRPQNEDAAKEHIQSFATLLEEQAQLNVPNRKPLTQELTAWCDKLTELGFHEREIKHIRNGIFRYRKPNHTGFLRRNDELTGLGQTKGLFRLPASDSWWDFFMTPLYYLARIVQNYLQRNYVLTLCKLVENEGTLSTQAQKAVEDSDALLLAALENAHYTSVFRTPEEEAQELSTSAARYLL